MSTRDALLHCATALVRTRGYIGFSYADMAAQIGIRKASIHHHFPTKEDLGVALVQQYTEQFEISLSRITSMFSEPQEQLRHYVDLYRQSFMQGFGCLCGMLSSEIAVIPERVAHLVQRFMEMNINWLTHVIKQGQKTGQLKATIAAEELAAAVLSTCQGALILARAMKNIHPFNQAVEVVLISTY